MADKELSAAEKAFADKVIVVAHRLVGGLMLSTDLSCNANGLGDPADKVAVLMVTLAESLQNAYTLVLKFSGKEAADDWMQKLHSLAVEYLAEGNPRVEACFGFKATVKEG